MSEILYAWELGDALGHAGPFLLLGRALRARGHSVHLALAQAEVAARLPAAAEFNLLQAPVCVERAGEGPPVSYSDILLRFGYADAAYLGGMVEKWRELLRRTGARVVLANHAPTAILAARSMGVPVMLFSSGFCVPPRQRPTPNMRPWQFVPGWRLDALENQALAGINAVLTGYAHAPLGGVAELFAVEEDTLCGFPELDHYAERGPARYWGNLPDAGISASPPWPPVPGKRIFAYLRIGMGHYEAALAALHALRQPALIFFPDAPSSLLARYAAPHLFMSAVPVNLVQAARDADAAVTYASVNTTSGFLLQGKPLLLLPGHLEQFLLARRVEEMGAGLLVNPEQPASDLPQKLERILADQDFRLNAEAFSRKYTAFAQTTVIANLVRRIEAIAAAYNV